MLSPGRLQEALFVPNGLRERAEEAGADEELVSCIDPPNRPTHEIICGQTGADRPAGQPEVLYIKDRDKARKKDMANQNFNIEPLEQKKGQFLFYAYEQEDEASDQYLTYPMPYQLAKVRTVTPHEDGIVAHTRYTVQWWYSPTGYSGHWREWRIAGQPKGKDQWQPEHITHAQVVIGSVHFKEGRMASTRDQLHKKVTDALKAMDECSRYHDFKDTDSLKRTLRKEKTARDAGGFPGETDVHPVEGEGADGRVRPPSRQPPNEWVVLEHMVNAQPESEESEEEKDPEEEASSPPRKRRPGKAPQGEPEESDEADGTETSESDKASSSSDVSSEKSGSVDSGSDEGVFCEVVPEYVPRPKRPRAKAGDRPVGGGAGVARARVGLQ
jgi:hypothetical protein